VLNPNTQEQLGDFDGVGEYFARIGRDFFLLAISSMSIGSRTA
jgi:hypothetical protein